MGKILSRVIAHVDIGMFWRSATPSFDGHHAIGFKFFVVFLFSVFG